MKYWVFDLDGTLVDSLPTHFQTMGKVFRHFNRPFTEANRLEVLKLSANNLQNYFELQFGKDNSTSAGELFRVLTLDSFGSMTSYAGIEELLTFLKTQRIELAVWTARDLEAASRMLESTGLKSYFSICVSGTCVTRGKPHPEGLEIISNHFQSHRDEMVMIGDFDSDMLGAQAFGINAIRVMWDQPENSKKCDIAKWQFSRVADMLAWAKGIRAV